MTKLTQALKCGGSAISLALALAVPAYAQTTPPPAGTPSASEQRPATAADNAPEQSSTPVEAAETAAPAAAAQTNAPTEAIVITGTSIRGVAPVGSNLISVGREAIEQTGVQTVQQILKTVPAVVGLSSVGQGAFGSADAAGTNAPTIHGLGASASNSTLIIIDGHRFPLSGVNHALADPNIIPPNAIERVEVLPDGSSAVYGSDAVAGVINFITRRKFTGIEVSAQASFGDHYRAQQAGIIGGHTWDTGFLFGAYNYSHRGALRVRDRDFLDADNRDEALAAGIDLTSAAAQNAANLSTFFCDPAAITIGSNVYRFSGGTYGNPVGTAQSNAFCDITQENDLIPEETRNSFLVKGEQQVTDRLTVGVDVVYSNRKNFQRTSRASGNSVANLTVYGPGSTPPAGASINPFFVTVPGTTATSYNVRFSGDSLLGPGAYNKAGEEAWYAQGKAEYAFSDNWRASAAVVVGTTDSTSRDVGRLCTSCAQLALNGGPVSIPGGQSVTQVLTTANALDVWGQGRTSAAVLAQLTDSTVTQATRQGFKQFRGQVNGDLFELPAGTVKVAAGAEYLDYTIGQDVTRPNGLGPATTNSRFLHLDYDRNVKALFGELFIPVVSPEMGIPGVRSLDLNLAGRYDKYSDFGSTKNPKIGVNWEVIQGIKLRGSWAKSFVAPALTSRGADQFGTTAESNIAAGGTVPVPISAFPTVTSIPGVASSCTATTCTLNGSTIRGLQINGGNAALQPQKGKTWSLGIDVMPSLLQGFRFSATYWHNQIRGGITAPQAAFAVFGDPSRLQIFPAGLTATSPQLLSIIGNRPLNTTLSGTYYYVYSFVQGNVLNLTAEGIDADARYRTRTSFGSVDAGVSLSRKVKFDQSFGTAGSFSVLNTTGFNTTFPSIKTDLRADAGVNVGGFGARVYVNHTGAYRNWSNNAIVAPVRGSDGLPTGEGGDPVKSLTTVDLHVDYDLPPMGFLPKTNVYIDVTNLFDKKPPFYNAANGGYDTFGGNPIMRVVAVGARVKF